MVSTPSANLETAIETRGRGTVDPALAKIIQRADAPQGVPKAVQPPAEMPGTAGIVASITGLFGAMRNGMTHLVDEGLTKFGDIYRMPFIHTPTVWVWDADEIHKILKNEDQVWSTGMGWDALMFERLDKRSGNVGTLLSLDFGDHRLARKLVQPAFTLRAIEGYLAIAERSFSSTLAAWVERGHVQLKSEARTLLARVAGEIFTGLHRPEDVAIVDRALSEFWYGMMALTRNAWLSPTHRKARRGLATLLQTFLSLVPERRKSGGDDLFSHMCANEETDGLTDEAMVRVFVTIMFGAFDTTSAAMTSMGYLLAKHPEWQERLREEALAVPRGKLDVTAMKTLKQHEWVWKETLRLMPVNSFVPRCALRDVEVGGYKLKAGTLVAPMNAGMGRHPKWWKDPTKFDPERFSAERAEDRQHPGIFNPFGAGAHACVGMQLANMEMKVFWHQLLTRCRLRLTKDYDARHTFTPMGVVSGDVALTLEAL